MARSVWLCALAASACTPPTTEPDPDTPGVVSASTEDAAIDLRPLGRYVSSATFGSKAAESIAFHPGTARALVTNLSAGRVDVLDLSDPTTPALVTSWDVTAHGHHPNSVAVHGDHVAVAVEADDAQAPGVVLLYDPEGTVLGTFDVGAMPDMLTFTPDGTRVLVANEGEPDDDYTNDPPGSLTIIDLTDGVDLAVVSQVGFEAWAGSLPQGVRAFGPGSTVEQDMEPEFISVSEDSATAWVTLQENNAIAVLDVLSGTITDILPLGASDHGADGASFDPSDQDGGTHLGSWPVLGMHLPDGVATFEADGDTWLITANEGSTRAYTGYDEVVRVADASLDPASFPGAAELQRPDALGRLKVTRALGDDDGDDDLDTLYTFGSRSVSIWSTDGTLVWDSGDEIARIVAAALPDDFNCTSYANGTFDERSDNQGTEPEVVVIADVGDSTHAFVTLERVGGVIVYDLADPRAPAFVQYVNTRDFAGDAEAGTAGDLSPEGMTFVEADDSPTGRPLLLLAHEVSGTTTIYEVESAAPDRP